MINYTFTRICLLLAFFFIITQSKASEGKPVCTLTIHQPVYAFADTVPPVKKTTEDKPADDKPATTGMPVIKEVPKARKQIKPVALPAVPVKPIKVIKPIIKRVGSLIH